MQLIRETPSGLYCEAGGFFVDPIRGVDRAVVTHAHGDHVHRGSAAYLCANSGKGLLAERLGGDAKVAGLAFGEPLKMNGVTLSFYPAGHILGSSQIRIEQGGEVWVVSGDYKRQRDPSCEEFELVGCDTFITESTFGLPVYRWPDAGEVFSEIDNWWRRNQEAGLTSVIFAYSLGKAQRILASLDSSIGPILLHGSVSRYIPHYRNEGFPLKPADIASLDNRVAAKGRGLVIAPSSTQGSPWLRKFGPSVTAFASGWMRIRGQRRRRALDRGFVVSDHVDWDGLTETVEATGAENIGITHGSRPSLLRWLVQNGWNAFEIGTRERGETGNLPEEELG